MAEDPSALVVAAAKALAGAGALALGLRWVGRLFHVRSKEDVDELKMVLEERRLQAAEQIARVERLREQFGEAEKREDEWRGKYHEARDEITKLHATVDMLTEELAAAEREEKRKEKEIEFLKDLLDGLRKERGET